MLGLTGKDTWTLLLLALSAIAFTAAARWYTLFAAGRALVVYSVGFSLAFVVLALLSGLSVLR